MTSDEIKWAKLLKKEEKYTKRLECKTYVELEIHHV